MVDIRVTPKFIYPCESRVTTIETLVMRVEEQTQVYFTSKTDFLNSELQRSGKTMGISRKDSDTIMQTNLRYTSIEKFVT